MQTVEFVVFTFLTDFTVNKNSHQSSSSSFQSKSNNEPIGKTQRGSHLCISYICYLFYLLFHGNKFIIALFELFLNSKRYIFKCKRTSPWTISSRRIGKKIDWGKIRSSRKKQINKEPRSEEI